MAKYWWLIAICGCLMITFRNAMFRACTMTSWLWVVGGIISIVCMVAFWFSFEHAPSFFQMWFFGAGILSVTGFVANALLFSKPISPLHYVGMVLAIGGSYLLMR